jgi:Flp pilus assembly protein TadG
MWPHRGHGADRGAAAVEFALVIPLFLLLVFGIVDFSRAFNIQMTLSDAAAEGARTLATGGNVVAAQSAVSAVLAATLVSPTEVVYPASIGCAPAAVPGTTRASMTVQTKDFHLITPLIGSLSGNLTISGTAARQCAN